MIYGKVAISAVTKITSRGNAPAEAWNAAAIERFKPGGRSIDKACPRNAFLGLCEEGLLKGVQPGTYTKSALNKKYAVQAVKILKEKRQPITSRELWNGVLQNLGADLFKRHNSQMDVVLALWNENCIVRH
jgi:hypothetical protein